MIGYLDCSTGVSGDKFLAAVLDVGTQVGAFTADDLARTTAALAPEAGIRVTPRSSHGITALGVEVDSMDTVGHRTWGTVRSLLESAELPAPVLKQAVHAFQLLAEAEAAVHGCAVDDVHFHEVGALDSIVDVVGVCAGVHALGIDSLHCSAVATGWGTVASSHGALPVPAPATERLLRGVPCVPGPSGPDGVAPGELTTPTGAALVQTLMSSFGAPPAFTPSVAGYGAGTRDICHPNVCRLTVGDVLAAADDSAVEQVVLLETNLDHLAPEAIGHATEEVLCAGALDVWQTPVVMKKQRAAVVLSVLARPDDEPRLTALVGTLTGTLGIRRTEMTRTVSAREIVTFDTPHGPARAKVGAGTIRPEHDDVARISRETGAPYAQVRAELEALAAIAITQRTPPARVEPRHRP